MRILIVNHYAYTPDDPAGNRHWSLAHRIKQGGHDVRIVSCSFFHKSRRERFADSEPTIINRVERGVPFTWIRAPSYDSNNWRRIVNMVTFAVRVIPLRLHSYYRRWRPDVIVGSSPDLLTAYAASLLATHWGSAFVFEVRDIWPETLVMIGTLNRKHPAIRCMAWLERQLYGRADRIVTLLPGSKSHIIQHGGIEEKVQLVPNGVDLQSFGEPPSMLSTDPLTLGYVGAHGTANALDGILEAAALSSPQHRWRFIGDGPERSRLQARAEDLNLDNVSFVGPVPRTMIRTELGKIHVALLPLHKSPLYQWGYSHNKLWDYMAAARPILIATDAPYNPVEQAGAGWTVEPSDPAAISRQVERIAKLPRGDLLDIGLRGRAYVQQHHDHGRLALDLVEACYRALETRG